MRKRKIYVASSWRNQIQPIVVNKLRDLGHDIYDFRNPNHNSAGFNWKEISPDFENWTVDEFIKNLFHKRTMEAFKNDFDAMKWADTFVLVQPCGRSAHLELGWACGKNKTTIMLLEENQRPDLMFKLCNYICKDFDSLIKLFGDI